MELVLKLIVPLVSTMMLVLFGLRIVLRHVSRYVRERRIGELYWFHIVPENRYSRSSKGVDENVSALNTFVNHLSSNWPYFDRGVCSFIWNKEIDGQLRLYVGVDSSHLDASSSMILALAKGVNCRADSMDRVPNISTDALVVGHRSRFTPSTIQEKPSTSGSVATVLSESASLKGTIIVTIEPMRSSEGNRLEANISEESIMRSGQGSVFSNTASQARIMTSNGVRASVGASSHNGDVGDSTTLLKNVLGAIGTLGISTKVINPSNHHPRQVTWGALANILVTAILGIVQVIPFEFALIFGSISIVVLGLATLRSSLLAEHWFLRRASRGEIAVPPFMWWSIRWRVHGFIRGNYRHDAAGDRSVSNQIAPPSCKQVINMYGSSLTEFVSLPPHVTLDVAQETTPMVGFPSNLERKDGLFLGMSGSGQHTYYPLSDLLFGLFVAGSPGSGKSNVLQLLYAGICHRIQSNSEDLAITPIWGETKGEGAYDTWMLVRSNPRSLFVDAHNPLGGYRLALEGKRLVDGASPYEVQANCDALVSALQFAYGDGIRASSREILDHSLRIAMFLRPEEIKYLELDKVVDAERPNVVSLAYLVLGGDGNYDPGPKLLSMMKQDLSPIVERDALLAESIGTLSRYLDPSTRNRLMERLSSPLNKLSDLRNARSLWSPSPDRKDIYVGDIVNLFAPVVVNMGPFWDPNSRMFKQDVSTVVSRRLILSFNYILWNYIKSYCSGWGRMGRRIPMFFDEVADVAVDSDSADVPNVFAEGHKEGRSRGAAYFVASQHLEQLPYQARHEVMSLRSKIWFGLRNTDDARIVFNDIGSGEQQSAYTQNNIENLPDGVAIAQIKQEQTATPAFTLQVPNASLFAQYLDHHVSVEDAIRTYVSDGNGFAEVPKTPTNSTIESV